MRVRWSVHARLVYLWTLLLLFMLADLLVRANKLQKAMKKRKTSYGVIEAKDDSVLIAVCEMKETTPGVFSRARCPYIEIEANKSDTYVTLALKAATKCRLSAQSGKKLSLFKMNGAQILDEDLRVKGKVKPWTLGNYLLVMKKAPSTVKIGVCYINIPQMSASDSDDSVESSPPITPPRHSKRTPPNAEVVIAVEYFLKVEKDGMMPLPVSRENVAAKQGLTASLGVYHPEKDGYEVASICKDGERILSPLYNIEHQKLLGFVVEPGFADPNDFNIAWQSPAVVTAKCKEEAIVLYCIATTHGVCKYRWKEFGKPGHKFPSSPVTYTDHGGLYQCIVTCGSATKKSKVISVRVAVDYECLSDESSLSQSPPKVDDPLTSAASPILVDDNVDHEEVVCSGLTTKGSVMEVVAAGSAPGSIASGQVQQFRVEDMAKATKDFSPEYVLGKGGFGVVYKGLLNGTYVAIKRLTEDGAMAIGGVGEKKEIPQSCTIQSQLRSEMQALTRCRHQNLVDLMGFCTAPPMLVYEYMEQGNLYKKLHEKDSPRLNWLQRSRILKDICRGLTWLHGAQPPLIHGDVKTCNILLDSHLLAKLGDFGFTTEGRVVEGRTLVTAVSLAKSLGYSAPEKDTGRHSAKSDMYSYGVVVLETFSGQKAYSPNREDPMLAEHLDEERKTVEGYQSFCDTTAGELAPYLLNLYKKIIENCLLKHSKRPSSEKVMWWWCETNF